MRTTTTESLEETRARLETEIRADSSADIGADPDSLVNHPQKEFLGPGKNAIEARKLRLALYRRHLGVGGEGQTLARSSEALRQKPRENAGKNVNVPARIIDRIIDWIRRQKPWQLALKLFAGAVAVYLLFSPLVAMPVYNDFVFGPINYEDGDFPVPDIEGITPQVVSFKSSSHVKLSGLLFVKPNAKHFVVFSHGRDGNVNSGLRWAETFLRANCSVLLYDYAGYGMSGGAPSISEVLRDGNAAYDFVAKSLAIPASKIIICGYSLGTGVASHTAGQRPCRAVILVAPYASLRALCQDVCPILKIYPPFLFPSDIGSYRLVRRPHPLVLLLHGSADETISVRNSDKLARSARPPTAYIRMPGVGHCNFFGRTFDSVIQWFIDELCK